MYNDVVKYIKLLARYQLTQNQFLAIYLVKHKRNNLVKLYQDNMPDTLLTTEQKEDLIKRGFLEKNGNKIKIGKLGEEMFIDRYIAAQEAWDAYPAFSRNSDKTFPLKGVDKNSFVNLYWKVYKGIRSEHKDILEDIEYGNFNGLINMRIDNFFNAEMYKEFRKMRRTSSDSDTSIETNTNLTDLNEF